MKRIAAGLAALLIGLSAAADDGPREAVYKGTLTNTTHNISAASEMRLVFEDGRISGAFTLDGLEGAGALAGAKRGDECFLTSTSGIRFEGRCAGTSFEGTYRSGDQSGQFRLTTSTPAAAPGTYAATGPAWLLSNLYVPSNAYPAGMGPRWRAPVRGWESVTFGLKDNVVAYPLSDRIQAGFGLFGTGRSLTEPGRELAVGFNVVTGKNCAQKLVPRARNSSGAITLGATPVWFDTNGDLIDVATGQRCEAMSSYMRRFRGSVGLSAREDGTVVVDAEFKAFGQEGRNWYVYTLRGYEIPNRYTPAEARSDMAREEAWRRGEGGPDAAPSNTSNLLAAALFAALIAGALDAGPSAGDPGRMSDYERHRRMRDYYTERDADFQDWVNSRPDIYR